MPKYVPIIITVEVAKSNSIEKLTATVERLEAKINSIGVGDILVKEISKDVNLGNKLKNTLGLNRY